MSSGYSVESNPQDMDGTIWNLFRELRQDVRDVVSLPQWTCSEEFSLPPLKRAKFEASSSMATSAEDTPRQSRQINNHVYEVCSPPAGKRPSVELIFFHGLQLKESDGDHLTTWLTADKSDLWLIWILQDILDARILIISYDANPKMTSKKGRMDMFLTTENVVQCLIDDPGVHVGQDGCPVVLVGHCIGGLVMKQLCVYAAKKLGLNSNKPNDRWQRFLNNVKGLFFYASPHHGTRLADLTEEKGKLFEDFTTLNTKASRQNADFCQLRQDKGWRTFGIGEAHEVTLGSFRGLVVPEASARHDVDGFYTAAADHFNVCRPQSKTSSEFLLLLNFILGIVKQDQLRHAPKIALKEAVGLEQQVKKVVRIMKSTKRVGIFGIGGLGKSTLAKCVYDTTSRDFEYTCFLGNVKLLFRRETGDKCGVLRDKIIGSLFEKDRKVNEKDFNWRKLKGKKVLLVLDDVEDESQVMVMTKEDSFSDDSRVIVTSRDRGQFDMPEENLHFAEKLNHEDSKFLFCFHAFDQTHPAAGYEDRVTLFTKKCAGLPLALKVAGRYLRPRGGRDDPKRWKDALLRLENARSLNGNEEDGLWSILKTSFKSLAHEEQEMFKDIGKCFHGESLCEVKEVWKTCGWAADGGWTNLLDKGLVTEVIFWQKYSELTEVIESRPVVLIEMHEMLRDLGRSIACPARRNIASHSRVHYNSGETWPFSNEDNPKAEVLKITSSSEDRRVSSNIEICELRKLEKLRVLWVEGGGSLHGGCHFFPKELVHVRIKDVDSWSDSSPSTEMCTRQVGQREKHKSVKRQNRTLLFVKLENCRLRTLPESFWQLHALECLTISRCKELSLPDNLGQLKALKRLVIQGCRSLGNLGDFLGQMQALEHLEIRSLSDEDELENAHSNTLGQLQALKHLALKTHYFAKDFQENLMKLLRLEHLEIQAGRWLHSLPNDLGELQALKVLMLDGCWELQHLPDSLGQLKALEYLYISRCKRLRSFPSTAGTLHALKKLEMCFSSDSSTSNFSGLSDILVELHGLEHLEITGYLNALPDTLGQLRGLRHLTLRRCNLKVVPDSIRELQALEFLYLSKCRSLEALPDTIGTLQALTSLQVRQCPLKVVPGTIGGLKALKKMEFRSVDFEALPDSIGLLHDLHYLSIYLCKKLRALPRSIGQLKALRGLWIVLCPELEGDITDFLPKLQNLEVLSIEDCPRLENVPKNFYY